jgi:uncharacterized protein
MTRLILNLILVFVLLATTGFAESEEVTETRKKAEAGDATYQSMLGFYYTSGIGGVAKDNVEAFKWYRKAAEQGEDGAQHSLGRMYANGEGVAKDNVEAVKWCRKAAEQGNLF